MLTNQRRPWLTHRPRWRSWWQRVTTIRENSTVGHDLRVRILKKINKKRIAKHKPTEFNIQRSSRLEWINRIGIDIIVLKHLNKYLIFTVLIYYYYFNVFYLKTISHSHETDTKTNKPNKRRGSVINDRLSHNRDKVSSATPGTNTTVNRIICRVRSFPVVWDYIWSLEHAERIRGRLRTDHRDGREKIIQNYRLKIHDIQFK